MEYMCKYTTCFLLPLRRVGWQEHGHDHGGRQEQSYTVHASEERCVSNNGCSYIERDAGGWD